MQARRAALACDVCRSRRTKCDAQKPSCSFCADHDLPCTYRKVPPQAPSKHDTEIQVISERLDYICSLLASRPFGTTTSTAPGVPSLSYDGYPTDESIISRNWRMEFPFMTIQTPSMMCLLGLDPKLAANLVATERTHVSNLTPAKASSSFAFQYQREISAFRSYYDKINVRYPVLDVNFFDVYAKVIAGDLLPSLDSCMVLLVASIGSVAHGSSIKTIHEIRPDACYIEKALTMVPNIHFEFGLRSVQCLILLGIYYKAILKPCQAHDYILMASCRAQALFKCHYLKDDTGALELLRRCFWSALLIETELSYHLDMPESNIWKFDDRILLPGVHISWQPISATQREVLGMTPPLQNSTSSVTYTDAGKAFFLAEISMCRMMRRCTTSLTLFNNREVYAPIIAAELAKQLERWYECLPPEINFSRYQDTLLIPADALNPDMAPPTSSIPSITHFLKMQYYTCLTCIYWPAVYSTISMEISTPPMLEDCARFFDAYAAFVLSAASSIPCCPTNQWSSYAGLFITSMAAIEGARTACLRATISPGVLRCFHLAAEIFNGGEAIAISPSISTMGRILTERVRGLD